MLLIPMVFAKPIELNIEARPFCGKYLSLYGGNMLGDINMGLDNCIYFNSGRLGRTNYLCMWDGGELPYPFVRLHGAHGLRLDAPIVLINSYTSMGGETLADVGNLLAKESHLGTSTIQNLKVRTKTFLDGDLILGVDGNHCTVYVEDGFVKCV